MPFANDILLEIFRNEEEIVMPFRADLQELTYEQWCAYHALQTGCTSEEIDEAWGKERWIEETGGVNTTNALIPYFANIPDTEDLKAKDFFVTPDFEIEKEDSMYSLTHDLASNGSEVFKNIIPNIKYKRKLDFLAQLTNHSEFHDAMKNYITSQRTAMIDFLTSTIETKLTPFTEGGRIIRVREEYSSAVPSLSGMISVFLRRLDDNNATTDTIKMVAVTKQGFLVRFSNIGNRRYKYYFFFVDSPLNSEEWKRVTDNELQGCFYFPKLELTNRLTTVYSESGVQDITKETITSILKGSRINVRDKLSKYEECTRRDIFKMFCKDTATLTKGFKDSYYTNEARAYNLDEMRLAGEGDKPHVVIATTMSSRKSINFKAKKGINEIISLALRAFPLAVSNTNYHDCKILAPLLEEDGNFSTKTNFLYSVCFFCQGRTMFCEFMALDYTICFAFLLDSVQLELPVSEIENFKKIINEDYEVLNLDKITDYKGLNNMLSQNVGKIARKMMIDRILSSDKFYVDENFKSFFDGIKSSLDSKLSKPVTINGKKVDSRVAPTLFASATKDERRMLEIIKTITNRNYYNGGVCVNVKRD